jgi:gliding motility-associated-like protein
LMYFRFDKFENLNVLNSSVDDIRDFSLKGNHINTVNSTLKETCSNCTGSVNLGAERIICKNGSVELDAGNFTSYLWSTGATSRSISVTSAGLFSVTVSDLNGCKYTDNVTVNATAYSVDLGSDQEYCETTVLSAGNFPEILWNTGETSPDIIVSAAGIYSVSVKDIHGCVHRDTVEFINSGLSCCEPEFIPNVITPGTDNKNDFFILPCVNQFQFWVIRVVNRWGKIVYFKNDYKNDWNGEGLGGGVYYYYLFEQNSGNEFKGIIHILNR